MTKYRIYSDDGSWYETTICPESGEYETIIVLEPTEDELQKIALQQQIDREFSLYQKRRKDGIEAYNKINAEFRVLKLNGIIEQNYYDAISELLEGVIFQITNGQWISGLQKLQDLGSSDIGTQLYNRLHLQITNYISENYE